MRAAPYGVSCAALCYVVCLGTLCAVRGTLSCGLRRDFVRWGGGGQLLCGALVVLLDGWQSCGLQAELRTGAGAMY